MTRWMSCCGGVGAVVSALAGGCGGEVEQGAGNDAGIVSPTGPVFGDAGRPPTFDAFPPFQFPDAREDVTIGPIDDAGFDAGFDAEGDDASFDTGIPDSGVDSFLPDGGWNVAAHYPMPTVVDFDGPILSSPVFTAITFPGYDLTTEAQQFVSTVGTTGYWTTVVSEYGIGPATSMPPIALTTEQAPGMIDDSAVQTWLAGKLDGSATNAAFGTPTDESVYVIFYPTGTTVTLQGLQSCVEGGFGGYHNSVALTSGPWAGLNVAYAVVPECSFQASTADQLTESASHELIEATTDPLPLTQNPAYAQTDQNDIVWEVLLGGGEVADMCAQNPNADFVPAGFATPVQRSWSNEAASAGHDPCQPSEAGVAYFNAIPNLNAMVTLTYEGQAIPTEGLRIPLQGKQTVEVDLYSDGPTEDWTVSADDLSDVIGGGPYLDFSWDQTTGNNGSTLHLTITVLAASPYGGQPFEIVSQNSSGGANFWLGYVGQN
jgi:hypothetical protein